jgi:hypothetical protein
LIPEKILDKPGAISDLQSFTDKRPLAGRFSEIGERIFELGRKKASQICTGPWQEMSIMDGKNSRVKGKPFPINPTLKAYAPAENHTNLHHIFIPPAYLTDPNITYTGSKRDAAAEYT